ncbi:MAG TPA: endonuclease/exonuclease/phosphatase family protein [Candidatus Binatia bacterium]
MRNLIRILTLNTWHNHRPWQQRRNALVQGIVQYAPDILLFQELFDTNWSNELQARFGFPYLVSTQSIQSGLVVLSRLAAHGSEVYRMKTKSPFETYSRYALWTELGSADYRLSVFNTHLSWELQDDATRQAQVAELWSFMEKHRSGFIVVAGDFNCTPDSLAMTWLISHSGFVDTYAILHPGEVGFTWSNKNFFAQNQRPLLPERRIDYVLADPGLVKNRLRRCEVVFDVPQSDGMFASDHFGVLAEFEPYEGADLSC